MSRYVEKVGGHIQKTHVVERVIEKAQEIDFAKLANAVAQAIEGKFGKQAGETSITRAEKPDTFDSTKTMEKIANSMLVQRGKNEANFDDLGNVKETKKDIKETNATIDLLSNLTD